MNDGQSNNNTGVTPITPITPITPTQPQVSDNSAAASGQAPTTPVQAPASVVPNLTPVDTVSAPANDGGKIDVVNPVPMAGGGGSTVLMPNTVLPEVKGETSAVSAPAAPVANEAASAPAANSPQLSLENASPFDIGVNAPISTNSPVVDASQGGMSTIPVTNNNVNNSNASDINIVQSNNASDDVISVKTYIINMLLFSIPVVGFIILIVKALDKKNKNISNFAKAYFVYTIIAIILAVVAFFVIGLIGASFMEESGMYY